MYKVENFPTFRTWIRAIVAPRKRARHSLGKTKKRPSEQIGAGSALAEGEAFMLEGVLKPGFDSKYSINGKDFIIDDDTWIFGEIAYGIKTSVEGVVGGAGERLASKVIIQK